MMILHQKRVNPEVVNLPNFQGPDAPKIPNQLITKSSSDPHELMFYLTHILTFYPAFFVAFYLTSGARR